MMLIWAILLLALAASSSSDSLYDLLEISPSVSRPQLKQLLASLPSGQDEKRDALKLLLHPSHRIEYDLDRGLFTPSLEHFVSWKSSNLQTFINLAKTEFPDAWILYTFSASQPMSSDRIKADLRLLWDLSVWLAGSVRVGLVNTYNEPSLRRYFNPGLSAVSNGLVHKQIAMLASQKSLRQFAVDLFLSRNAFAVISNPASLDDYIRAAYLKNQALVVVRGSEIPPSLLQIAEKLSPFFEFALMPSESDSNSDSVQIFRNTREPVTVQVGDFFESLATTESLLRKNALQYSRLTAGNFQFLCEERPCFVHASAPDARDYKLSQEAEVLATWLNCDDAGDLCSTLRSEDRSLRSWWLYQANGKYSLCPSKSAEAVQQCLAQGGRGMGPGRLLPNPLASVQHRPVPGPSFLSSTLPLLSSILPLALAAFVFRAL